MDLNIGDKFNATLDVLFRWLPNLIGAVLIWIIGMIIGSVLQGLVSRLLRKSGVDGALAKSQLGRFVERATDRPSRFIGRVVYWIVMLGTIAIAVNTLGIPGLTAFVNTVYAYLPNVLAAFVIFLVASAVSAGVAALATRLMGDTPTGKLVATILPTLTMIIAVFMILNQLGIARDIVNITYTGLIATMVLAVGLSFGLGGRQVAAELLGKAYDGAASGSRRARQDVETARGRAERDIDEVKRRTS